MATIKSEKAFVCFVRAVRRCSHSGEHGACQMRPTGSTRVASDASRREIASFARVSRWQRHEFEERGLNCSRRQLSVLEPET